MIGLCLAGALSLLAGCNPAPPVGPGVWALAQGDVLVLPGRQTSVASAAELPLPPASQDPRWRPMALPDAWDTSRPDFMGYAWYRLPWLTPTGLSPQQPLAIYLPYASMNAQVWVNGHLVGQQGRLHTPVTRHFYTPLIFPLPHGVLRPPGQRNEVQVLLMGYRSYRSGLDVVHVGHAAALEDSWALRHFWQNTGTLISCVLVLAVAAYGAVMWWRMGREPMFGWFTLAALVWGLRNLNFVATGLPFGLSWDNVLWSQLSVSGAVVFVGLLSLFTLSYSRWLLHSPPLPRWQQALPLSYIVISVLAFLAQDDIGAVRWWFKPLGAGGLLLTLWSQWHLLSTAWRLRSKQVWAVAISGLAYLALMANDLQVANDHAGLGRLFLRHYAGVPLFLSVTLVWTHRYWRALKEAEHLSGSLQQQVDAQRMELERNFARLMAADRERAVAQERSRMLSDLHDGLGLHLLTAMKLAEQAGPQGQALNEALQDGLDELRLAIDSLANLEDRDPVLLLASLRFRLAPRLAAAGVQLDWQVEGELPPQEWMDAAGALHLLRLIQEALTNAVRHGRATQLRLRVAALGPHEVEVSLWDNGVGLTRAGELDPSAPDPGTRGHGLASMQRRAQALNARLDIGPAPEGGTLCRLRLGRPG